MNFVGNLLWFVLGGFVMSLKWLLLGVVLALTLIGIPFAIPVFRLAGFAASPFGREFIDVELLGEKHAPGTDIGNVVWIIFAGFWLALAHAILAIVLCLTIVGIPFGLAHAKLAQACFAPLGKRVVTTEVAIAARQGYFTNRMQPQFAPQAAVMPMPVSRKFCHACGTQVQVNSTICHSCREAQRPV